MADNSEHEVEGLKKGEEKHTKREEEEEEPRRGGGIFLE